MAFQRGIEGRCVLRVLTWSPKIGRGHFQAECEFGKKRVNPVIKTLR